jgi:hypothetical protein
MGGMMARRDMWRAALLLLWVALWFWAFSFGYSGSFFRYDPWIRLPVLGAAVWGAAALPVAAHLAWRSGPSLLRVLAVYWAGVGGALIPLGITAFVLSRSPGRWHLQADDAIGAGIDFLILVGLSVAIGVAVLVAWVGRWTLRRDNPDRGL